MNAMPMHSLYFSLMLCGLMSLAFSFKEAAVATPTRGCSEVERDALLAFKANVKDPSLRLASWSPQIDCCRWSGVVCKTNNASLFGGQHVVELNLQNPNIDEDEQTFNTALRGEILSPSLLNLTQLELLNLSGNDFEGTPIPHFIGSFQKLKYLELSWSNFSGVIPSQLGNLSSLCHLGLWSRWNAGAIAHRLDWLSGLSSLAYLDMSSVNLSTVSQNWLSVVNMLPSLRELDLEGCDLNYIPSSFSSHLNLTSLITLRLDGNDFNSTLPNWLWNLTKLSSLILHHSSLFGPIPTEIGTLSRLTELYLGFNNFTGSIPTSIANLSSLQSLFLSYCSLDGQIPSEIWNLISLTSLRLAHNSLSGFIPIEIGNLTNLKSLDLSFNLLSGSIPIEIGKLSNLQELVLSHNSLVGVVSELHLANLTNLKSLTLAKNSQIIISVKSNWVPSFQLEIVYLVSCTVGSRFPQWLRSQKSMVVLRLKNTSINDILPHWFWGSSSTNFWLIDLSQNMLRGTLPSSLEGMARLQVLNLGFNKFEGLVPRWPPNLMSLNLSFNNFSGPLPSKISPQVGTSMSLAFLILSNNHINGSIPSFICKLEQLVGLDLSHNRLSGEIPNCWQETNTDLSFIHLGNNKLNGEIPSSIGNLIGLESLHLDNNNFSGQLPMSLQNCIELQVIDLTGNNFLGSIPTWMGQSLQQLIVLVLRSNMFSEIIPSNLGELSNLQILDLANNNLRGSIPYSFGNFNAIRSRSATHTTISFGVYFPDDDFFEGDSISIFTKGYEYAYSSILSLVKIIDLSNNSLTSEFPTTLGFLAGLQTLNLSRNFLKGEIPHTIYGMKSLETLDLSINNLSGVIPQGLSTLTALSHLNLSYNNLSGKIPSGNQLQTLEDASIYKGNIYLCGDVIHKNCFDYDTNNLIVEGYQNNTSQLLPLYLGSFVGYITGLWGVFIILLFKKEWRNFYFQMIDKMYNKIWVAIKIRMNRFSTS